MAVHAHTILDCAQVPTKVFSLHNSTAYVYPKEKMCVLLELGAASSLVTLCNCDVLMHFDTERDMQVFLLERKRVLRSQNLLPPPDGIFFVWIEFIRLSQNSGRGETNGRYALQIERQTIVIRKNDKGRSKHSIEMKMVDCRFQLLTTCITCHCFLGEFQIYSADDLFQIEDLISREKKVDQ